MDFKLSVEGYEINHLAANLSWSSNADSLGQSLTFEMPFDETGALLPKAFIKEGDKVTLRYKSKIVFFGIVVSVSARARAARAYTCFDLAFYLNKSKLTIQFNNKSADACIVDICKRFNIKVTVTSIPFKIKKIYKAETVSEILKDILSIAEKRSGKKYRFEMRATTLTIFVWRDMVVKLDADWISEPERTTSIENMINSVEIVAGDEKSVKTVASSRDAASIKKYGLLHHSEEIDEKEKAKAKQVADNLLKEMNKIVETGSVTLPGNYEARAGRMIRLNEPVTGLVGEYAITDAQHSLNNGIHMMTLSLEVV